MAKAIRPGSPYDQTGKAQCPHVFPYPSVSPSDRLFDATLMRNDRQESYGTPDTDKRTGVALDIGMSLESSGAAKKNGGMFEKGLLTALESMNRAGGAIPEVKVVANGHCHGAYARI